jgi:hypothetical protein
MSLESHGVMIFEEETQELGDKHAPVPLSLSVTNLTWTDPGANPGLCGERPVTNRLSHATAYGFIII